MFAIKNEEQYKYESLFGEEPDRYDLQHLITINNNVVIVVMFLHMAIIVLLMCV